MKAFPTPSVVEDTGTQYQTTSASSGMDLRDYFAAKVVSYLASEHKKEMLKDDCFDGWSDIDNDPTFDAEMVAMDAYAIADAMIKRRENK